MNEQSLLDLLQPLLGYFDQYPFIKSLLVLLITFTFANVTAFILTRVFLILAHLTRSSLDDQLIYIMRRPLFWSVIIVGSLVAILLLAPSERAMAIFKSVALTMLIVVWSQFFIKVAMVLFSALSARSSVNSLVRPQTLPLFNNLAMILVIGGAIYFIFQAWNIDMTAWLASAGIVGIAVGFAAKDTLANLFSGVFILADAPYKVGDYVVLESGERGKVTHIGIRSTRLLTRDDVEITIPNAIMGNTRIVNESGGPHLKFRIRIKVGVAYGSDIDKVREILQTIAEKESSVCQTPEPRVRFRQFGGSSLDFELLCWVDEPELRGRVVDALNTTIYKRFAEEGIEIPYSKHDVFIKEMPRAPE